MESRATFARSIRPSLPGKRNIIREAVKDHEQSQPVSFTSCVHCEETTSRDSH